MMDNEHSFLRTLRQSLSLPPDVERPKALFPSLFARADTAPILREINNRSTMEQEALVDILQTSAQALGITTYIVRNHDEAAAIIVNLVRTKDPEFTPTKHLIHHDHPDLPPCNCGNALIVKASPYTQASAPTGKSGKKPLPPSSA